MPANYSLELKLSGFMLVLELLTSGLSPSCKKNIFKKIGMNGVDLRTSNWWKTCSKIKKSLKSDF